MKTDVLREYDQQLAEVTQLMQDVQDGIKAYHRRNACFGNTPNYGHIGDLQHYAEQLRDLGDQLHRRGEYTP